MYEEYVKQSREELRKKFGEVRIKTDCQNYIAETGKDGCVVCNYDHHRGWLHCALEWFDKNVIHPVNEAIVKPCVLFLQTEGGKQMIKDSGSRTEFPSGAVRDIQAGKGRMDLLPWAAIMEVSKHCENGAAKYGEHNVDRGIPTHSLCDSAARHLAKYLDGWDDEPHLLAATWNLLWAVQMEIKHRECVDTPWDKNQNTMNCPVCGELLPKNAVFCGSCLVTVKKPDNEPEGENK